MKQILQHLNTGEMALAEIPCPAAGRGQVLIRTSRSLISAGTERMLVEFSKGNLLQKARSQPDKVKQVLDKMRTDGLLPTLEAVFRKLDEPLPLGYCNAGRVMGREQGAGSRERGAGDTEHRSTGLRGHRPQDQIPPEGGTPSAFVVPASAGPPSSCSPPRPVNPPPSASAPQVSGLSPQPSAGTRFPPGTRVISNGPHAEVVCVPENLCARIPDGVSDEAAAFTVLGAVALQGVRLAQPTLGERFMVFGMGLLGLMTVQLLRANGCEVMAVDVNTQRLALAARFGARTVDLSAGGDPITAAQAWTGGVGVDGVLITASAKTDEIMHQAAEACRQRGRIVLVGVVGLNLRRDDFFKKELSFQVSCSYGPGRYDEAYEQGGRDYPLGFVRWTEQRNFEAVLGAMASGALDVGPLITHRFPLSDALAAYDRIQHDPTALGVILEYPETVDTRQSIQMSSHGAHGRKTEQGDHRPQTTNHRPPFPSSSMPSVCSLGSPSGTVRIGVIGAGNYAKATLLPALAKTTAQIAYVADLNPVAAQDAARKFGAGTATTDHRTMLDDPAVQAVFILVGHHLHARFVCEALEAGKHVFVEKPLALNEEQLARVEEAVAHGMHGRERVAHETHECTQMEAGAGEVGATLRKSGTVDPPVIAVGSDRHRSGDAGADMQVQPPASPERNTVGCGESRLPTGGPGAGPLAPPSALQVSGFRPPPSLRAPILMVGFNRRFSPHTVRMKALLAGRSEPLTMTMTVNAGAIPPEHWTQKPEIGGGRIVGEGCHFIDLLAFLAGAPVVRVSAMTVGEGPVVREDKMSIQLSFADGSVGTVNYFANGAKSYPKELLEVFSDGRVLRMENFRRTTGYGFKGFRSLKTWRQDKGHNAEVAQFIERVAQGGAALIPFAELANATRASFAAVASAREGRVIGLQR